MNAEKLHAIVIAIRRDLKESALLTDLSELVSNLQNYVNAPNQPQYQNAISDLRQKLSASLLDSKINKFSPLWKQIVNELGASEILGYPLSIELDLIFSENQITPSSASSRISEIYSKLQTFSNSIDQLDASFNDLNIGSEELNAGDCEIGILIPRNFVQNKLKNFGDEIEELNKILGVFSELVTGGRPGFEIRTISSSDLSIFLSSTAPVCAAIAVAIERIVALYKNLLEIKKLHAGLAGYGVNADNLKGVKKHANDMIGEGIDKLIVDLEEKFLNSIDAGRRHELDTELRFSLKKIANRIDRGFNIEVRMAAPEMVVTKDESEETTSEANSYAEIRKAAENMQFINATGNPILQLPESDLSVPPQS